MSNPTSKKASRKLSLSIQTVHTTSLGVDASYAPTSTCVGCATSKCFTRTRYGVEK